MEGNIIPPPVEGSVSAGAFYVRAATVFEALRSDMLCRPLAADRVRGLGNFKQPCGISPGDELLLSGRQTACIKGVLEPVWNPPLGVDRPIGSCENMVGSQDVHRTTYQHRV